MPVLNLKKCRGMEQILFAPGDNIVCVDSKDSMGLLIEGNRYKVTEIRKCAGCGGVSVCVGIPSTGTSGFARCLRCGHREKETSKDQGFRQARFVPEDFDRYADNELHQALKGIPETL